MAQLCDMGLLKHIYLTVPGISCSMWNLVPWTGVEPRTLYWEHRVLATGLPGQFLWVFKRLPRTFYLHAPQGSGCQEAQEQAEGLQPPSLILSLLETVFLGSIAQQSREFQLPNCGHHVLNSSWLRGTDLLSFLKIFFYNFFVCFSLSSPFSCSSLFFFVSVPWPLCLLFAFSSPL